VYLGRYSKFCEPIFVHGIRHHFSFLVGNECKVFNVRPEEIAQAYERPDGFDVRGPLGVIDSF
jgi:hypothetical protein